MSRKTEILIGVLIILSLVAFIGVGIVRNLFDDEAKIEKIADVTDNNDLDYSEDNLEIEGKKKDSHQSEVHPDLYLDEQDIDHVEPVEEDIVEEDIVEEDIVEEVNGDEDIEWQIRNLMEGYQYGMVEAINNANYNYVEYYIENNSALNKSQVNLVKHLSSKGTTESLIGYTIHNITKISDTIYEMKVSEQHNVYYSSGKNDTVSNTWIYTVVKIGDSVYLRNLRK